MSIPCLVGSDANSYFYFSSGTINGRLEGNYDYISSGIVSLVCLCISERYNIMMSVLSRRKVYSILDTVL